MPEEERDPVKDLYLLKKHKCPKHGEIQGATMHIYFDNEEQGVFCMKCYCEKLREIGVSEVEEIK